jgi:hypothetical protein
MSHQGDLDETYVDLMHNGVVVAMAYAEGHQYTMGVTEAVLHLNVGDTVYVSFGGGHDHTLWGAEHTSFSGFRIAS